MNGGRRRRRVSWIGDELRRWDSDGLRRPRSVVHSLNDGWCEWNGRRLRNASSNDYLNLARDPRIQAAAIEAIRENGFGAGASALVSGRSPWHDRLETELARWESSGAALLFPSGMAANLGVLGAVAGPDDLLLCDRFNHASLVDGCRHSRARLRVYRHDRLNVVERELSAAAGFRRRFIVTDSVFSMEGDQAPLVELCDLADRFDAQLIVDEAHATGVFGDTGNGLCQQQGVAHRAAIRIGTLSKAIGSLGGFVVAPFEVIDFLWHRARTQIYSTALPAACCAAALAALEIIQTDGKPRRQLLDRCVAFRTQLLDRGIMPYPHSVGPIVSIIVGDADRAMRARQHLIDSGWLVAAIRPPTVSHGTSRLRISLTAAFGEDDLTALADATAAALT